jgi:hypothetical protein
LSRIEVAEGEDIKLLLWRVGRSASRIDRKQDRPGYETSHQADGSDDSKIAEEQIGIQRLVLQGPGVGDFPEGTEPID